MKFLFVINDGNFFLSHRGAIAEALIQAGHECHIACPDDGSSERLESLGIKFHKITMSRDSINPITELAVIFSLYQLYKHLKPDLIHHVTPKANVYGGIAARFASMPAVVFAVSGLGHAFVGDGLRVFMTRQAAKILYRLAFSNKNQCVIFQNEANQAEITDCAGLKEHQLRLIRGSGVNLEEYYPPDRKGKTLRVLMASRLLRDKGVLEYLTAVEILSADKSGEIDFLLAGGIDSGNPASLTNEEIEEINDSHPVKLLGHIDDMPSLLKTVDILCLPSYGEGFPRVLMEGGAAGCAIITTDVPGCRDAVVDGETGIIIPPKNAESLAEAIESLVFEKPRLRTMQESSRLHAEENFSIEHIVDEHLKLYWDICDKR